MGEDEVRLEASLVGRETGQTIEVKVLRAFKVRGSRWLTVLWTSPMGSENHADISMDNHIISVIKMFDSFYPEGYAESYTTGESEQIDAWNLLEKTQSKYQIVSSHFEGRKEEKSVVELVGPRRVEVTLRRLGGSITNKRIVLIDFMPPAGKFATHSLSGRVWGNWNTIKQRLDKSPTILWGTGSWIKQLDVYQGGNNGGLTTSFFSPDSQDQAWIDLEKLFYSFKQAELNVLRKWTPDAPEEIKSVIHLASKADMQSLPGIYAYEGDWYGNPQGSQHWTNPQLGCYEKKEPEKAHYRVSGDEVGIVIYREQQKTWEEEGSLSPGESLRQVLEGIPREEEVEEGTKKKMEAISTPTSNGHDSNSNAYSSRCVECGRDGCSSLFCNDDSDLGTFGGEVVIVDGGQTIH